MERIDDDPARYWAELRSELTTQLAAWIPVFFRDLPPAEAQTIHSVVREGKKLRGSMVLAVCDALAGPRSRALPSAVAIECVQAASLIHDDFVDRDCTRRDRPAVWIVHGSRRAVLLADVIFATALQRSAELGRDEVHTLASAIASVAAGAYQEPLESREMETMMCERGLEQPPYDRIAYLKTGALFAAAAELGAIAAGAAPAVRKAASEFGARAGEAYQIADDLSDVVARTGSDTRSAQHEATLATLLAHFRIRHDTDATDKYVVAARAIEKLCSAMELEIDARIRGAHAALEGFPRPVSAKLRAFPRLIVERMRAIS
ncbi:MAG TPA: polyprenyl synthetase family protein [Burkholderiales bacterium]|nr:polyprenyl synthetase family protein [Burkholderiales bacterium]